MNFKLVQYMLSTYFVREIVTMTEIHNIECYDIWNTVKEFSANFIFEEEKVELLQLEYKPLTSSILGSRWIVYVTCTQNTLQVLVLIACYYFSRIENIKLIEVLTLNEPLLDISFSIVFLFNNLSNYNITCWFLVMHLQLCRPYYLHLTYSFLFDCVNIVLLLYVFTLRFGFITLRIQLVRFLND